MNQTARSPGSLLFMAAALVIIIAGMRAAADLLVPFLASVFVAVICMPGVLFFRRWMSHGLSVAMMFIALVLVFIAVGTLIGGSLAQFADDLPFYEQRTQALWNSTIGWVVGLGIDINIDQLKNLIQLEQIFPFASNILSAFGSLMTDASLIILTVLFILAESHSLGQKLGNRELRMPQNLVDSVPAVVAAINQYMAIKTAISAGTGILITLMLWIVGVDYAVLWGVLAFLLNFVPTIGSLIAAVPAALLALIQLGPGHFAVVVAGYIAVNLVVGNLIEPRVMGQGLGLSAIVVLLSLVFWGWVLGPVGMLLSVPLTMMVKIGLEQFANTRWVAHLLS